jgi:hypothetical protein
MTYRPLNPEQPIPDNYRLLWDFSFRINDAPTGLLWRQRDKTSVLVLASYDVPIISNLDDLFPIEEPKVPAPAPELD